MDYPFAHVLAHPLARRVFENQLPQVSAALPEFFRVLGIAHQSIAQRNMYGQPQGIRHDLGIDTALKLLLMAGIQDGVMHAKQAPSEVIDTLRKLVLQWYALGHSLSSCVFFGYYFYTLQNQSGYVVKDTLQQLSVVTGASGLGVEHPDVAALLAPTHSQRWYRASQGLGDKLRGIFIAEADFTRTDLPQPSYHIHFKQTQQFDLRAPLWVPADAVETQQVQHNKVIVSCPRCGQKCRCAMHPHIEITCPSCQQHWRQRT